MYSFAWSLILMIFENKKYASTQQVIIIAVIVIGTIQVVRRAHT